MAWFAWPNALDIFILSPQESMACNYCTLSYNSISFNHYFNHYEPLLPWEDFCRSFITWYEEGFYLSIHFFLHLGRILWYYLLFVHIKSFYEYLLIYQCAAELISNQISSQPFCMFWKPWHLTRLRLPNSTDQGVRYFSGIPSLKKSTMLKVHVFRRLLFDWRMCIRLVALHNLDMSIHQPCFDSALPCVSYSSFGASCCFSIFGFLFPAASFILLLLFLLVCAKQR